MAQASLTINSATSPTSVADVIRAEAQRIIGTARADVCLQPGQTVPPGGLSHASADAVVFLSVSSTWTES